MPKLSSITKLLSGVAGALLMVGSQAAYAAPGTCTSTAVLAGPNFGGLFTVNAGGTTVSAGGVTYNCVQQQDKLFSNFNFGALPATGSATFNFSSVAGADTHTISLGSGNFSNGSTYTVGYNISIVPNSPTHPHLISTNSALLQTVGNSGLAETLVDNDAAVFHINFTQTGAIASGATGTPLDPQGDVWLDVTDTFNLASTGSGGSNLTGVSNSFVEGVPEPASLFVLGAGLAGLGLLRRRRKN